MNNNSIPRELIHKCLHCGKDDQVLSLGDACLKCLEKGHKDILPPQCPECKKEHDERLKRLKKKPNPENYSAAPSAKIKIINFNKKYRNGNYGSE